MKSIRLAILAAAAAFACGAFAADSQDINVNATVKGTCKLTTLNDLTFDDLDPSVGGDSTKSTDIKYKCTKGTAPSGFTVGGAADGAVGFGGSLAGSGTAAGETIGYTIKWTNPTGQGSGFGAGSTETTVQLNGEILEADYLNKKAGPYTEVVTIEINN